MTGNDQDHLGQFLAECTVRSIGHRVQSSVLHQIYRAWCIANDVSPLGIKRFAIEMKKAGQQKVQSNVLWWIDLKLVSSTSLFEFSEPAAGGSHGLAALEAAWRSASPLDALTFLQSKLRALGLQQ